MATITSYPVAGKSDMSQQLLQQEPLEEPQHPANRCTYVPKRSWRKNKSGLAANSAKIKNALTADTFSQKIKGDRLKDMLKEAYGTDDESKWENPDDIRRDIDEVHALTETYEKATQELEADIKWLEECREPQWAHAVEEEAQKKELLQRRTAECEELRSQLCEHKGTHRSSLSKTSRVTVTPRRRQRRRQRRQSN